MREIVVALELTKRYLHAPESLYHLIQNTHYKLHHIPIIQNTHYKLHHIPIMVA